MTTIHWFKDTSFPSVSQAPLYLHPVSTACKLTPLREELWFLNSFLLLFPHALPRDVTSFVRFLPSFNGAPRWGIQVTFSPLCQGTYLAQCCSPFYLIPSFGLKTWTPDSGDRHARAPAQSSSLQANSRRKSERARQDTLGRRGTVRDAYYGRIEGWSPKCTAFEMKYLRHVAFA